MSGVNKVILIGNLGADPELRYTTGGTAVCTLRLAVNERWKNKEGEWGDRVEWVTVVVWNKQAESCSEYLSKGRQIYVEGRLQTRNWEDKEGVKRWSTEVVAATVRFLGSKHDGTASASDRPRDSGGSGAREATGDEEPGDDLDDSIPF